MKTPKHNFKILFALLLIGFVFIGCSSDDDNSNSDTNNNTGDYDVAAHFEFSSGETLDFKANSILNFPEPFIHEENNEHRILTAAYQQEKGDLIYRLDIKAVFKDEPGSYNMYENDEDYLESPGFYMELTVQNKAGTGSTDDLYRTQYVDGESGNFTVSSLFEDRLKGTFNAVIPYMPLENGKNLKITNGGIDIEIMRVND